MMYSGFDVLNFRRLATSVPFVLLMIGSIFGGSEATAQTGRSDPAREGWIRSSDPTTFEHRFPDGRTARISVVDAIHPVRKIHGVVISVERPDRAPYRVAVPHSKLLEFDPLSYELLAQFRRAGLKGFFGDVFNSLAGDIKEFWNKVSSELKSRVEKAKRIAKRLHSIWKKFQAIVEEVVALMDEEFGIKIADVLMSSSGGRPAGQFSRSVKIHAARDARLSQKVLGALAETVLSEPSRREREQVMLLLCKTVLEMDGGL